MNRTTVANEIQKTSKNEIEVSANYNSVEL